MLNSLFSDSGKKCPLLAPLSEAKVLSYTQGLPTPLQTGHFECLNNNISSLQVIHTLSPLASWRALAVHAVFGCICELLTSKTGCCCLCVEGGGTGQRITQSYTTSWYRWWL